MVTQNGVASPSAWSRLRSTLLCLAAGAGLLAIAGARSASGEPPEAGQRTVEVARAAHPIAVLAVMASTDVTTATVPLASAEGTEGLTAGSVAGRRLLVALPAGALITSPMLAPVGHAPPGSRDLRIAVDALRVSPSVVAGGDAEVLTVSNPAAGGGPARAAIVAVVHILEVSSSAPPGSDLVTPSAIGSVIGGAGRTTTGRTDAAQLVITFSCDPPSALRIALALDAGMSIRLLGHSPGDSVPAPQASS